MTMFSLSDCFQKLLRSLPPHHVPSYGYVLDRLVEDAITESKQYTSTDNWRGQWEFLLRNEVLRIAETEGMFPGEPDSSYYDSLYFRLDLVLAFTEREACDGQFASSVLEDLLETQTIASCSRIFSWMEKHSSRLTEGMVHGKGKALVFLRSLNDLLRRVSKTGDTMFCGRILTFLSSVFPLGDRSGVNLRGDYGPPWEPVSFRKGVGEVKMDVEEATSPKEAEEEDTMTKTESVEQKKDEDVEMNADEKPSQQDKVVEKTEEEKKEEFYNTFWSLQAPFSRPSVFATDPNALSNLKAAVNVIMPFFKEATIKEWALMGSKVGKVKRESSQTLTVEDGDHKYFFAKFLTSPELLELEIADTQFRRQILIQLLILLNHLLQFTATEKQNWATPRNRSLQMDFTLQPDDAKWVQETIARVVDEMKQTSPNARAFTETVQTILEREKNWIRWKNDLCGPFDKPPLPISLEEETAHIREKMREPLEEYPHKLGSEALTEIWAMGYRGLRDLENRFDSGDVRDFVKSIEKEDARIKFRKQQLEKQQEARARAAAADKSAAPSPAPATPAAPSQAQAPHPASAPSLAPVAPIPQRPTAASPPLHPSLPAKPGTQPVLPTQPSPAPAVAVPTPQPAPAPTLVVRPKEQTDPIIQKAEENKQRIAWLALRLARDEYLHLFGKIGAGDIVLLAQELEKEKERMARGESVPANPEPTSGSASDRAPSASQDANKPMETSLAVAEAEIKVEEPTEAERLTGSAENAAMSVDA